MDTGLRELGTDYVDIRPLHLKNTRADVTDDLLEAQPIARQQGRIRIAGVSMDEGYHELIPLVAKRSRRRGHYSQRSACWGWMRVIRRAGTQAAPRATAAIATAIPPKTSGSAPVMRKKRAFRARLSP
jgi:aryl-alcohol dehydrogenase-like predicted oxidoreductase